jgi:DNA-directed RNA polymerase subunit H
MTTQHTLIPKHSKLSDSEKKQLLEQYQINLAALPKIQVKDSAIVKLNLKDGDVVKIARESKTAGLSYYYRVVINE